MEYTVTRQEIIEASESLLGLPFVHQGRSVVTGVDCVGLLVCIARLIGYPHIVDVEGYRRIPSAETIRETLGMNCDEIPVEECRPGDIFLMRTGGIKARHAAVFHSDETDTAKGIRPMLLHAVKEGGVKLEPKSMYPDSWFIAGFRMRGLVD